MCAIAGIISKNPLDGIHYIDLMCQSMLHRGPDASGKFKSQDQKLIFGHNRLSIIDLSESANQPFHIHKLGLSIVYNGEIYNHNYLREILIKKGYQFRSDSDTEVLLTAYAEWGTDSLSRFNGMFSFAIYDEKNSKVFFARDRAGEKPLFYYQKNEIIYFASELKALMAHPELPRKIDPSAFDCYLSMGFIPSDLCILKDYKKLPAAHAMTFDMMSAETNVWQYWELPPLEKGVDDTDQNQLLAELETLLEESVERQLIADVPVGILLSGGVDSSLITALASRKSSRVKTFSVGFPGYGVMDETPHARLIADYFGTEHIELVAEDNSVNLLPQLVKQFDEPMVDSSMFPTWLVCNLVGQHCKVALGGDGGDELFGGYGHYSRLLKLEKYQTFLPKFLSRSVANLAHDLLPFGFANSNIRTWLMVAGVDLNKELPDIRTFFDPVSRMKLMSDVDDYSLEAEQIWNNMIPGNSDLLQRATRMDFKNYLAEDILVKVDRASMLNSIEMRAPLLDYKIIEFAFRQIPSNLKANENGTKILLKQLAKKLLPDSFDFQRKQGFSIPLSEWLKNGPFRELFWDTLLQDDCIFNTGFVKSLLHGQDNGRKNGERLFALVFFELWRREYDAYF